MTTSKATKTTKKPKRNKPTRCISLKEYIPNYRDFQRELARIEEMLGPDADPTATLDLPEGISRQWAQDAWPIVKANAELYYRPSEPGTGFPSGFYADRAMWALTVASESPFNDRLKSLARSQILDVAIMKEKARDKRIRAEKRAARAAATTAAN